MMGTVVTVLAVGGVALGLTLVTYTSCLLMGGGGQRGEEDAMFGQLFLGFAILLAAHIHGVVI